MRNWISQNIQLTEWWESGKFIQVIDIIRFILDVMVPFLVFPHCITGCMNFPDTCFKYKRIMNICGFVCLQNWVEQYASVRKMTNYRKIVLFLLHLLLDLCPDFFGRWLMNWRHNGLKFTMPKIDIFFYFVRIWKKKVTIYEQKSCLFWLFLIFQTFYLIRWIHQRYKWALCPLKPLIFNYMVVFDNL